MASSNQNGLQKESLKKDTSHYSLSEENFSNVAEHFPEENPKDSQISVQKTQPRPSPNRTGQKQIIKTTWTSPLRKSELHDPQIVIFENIQFNILQAQEGTSLKMATLVQSSNPSVYFLKSISNYDNASNVESRLKALKSLPPHPNILPLYGEWQNQNNFNLIYKFSPSLVSLSHLVLNKGILNLILMSKLLLEISYGLNHLRSLGIQHGNLSPDNILIDLRDERVKLTEYGFTPSFFGYEDSVHDDALDLLTILQDSFNEMTSNEKTKLPNFIFPYLNIPINTLQVGPSTTELIEILEQIYNWSLEHKDLFNVEKKFKLESPRNSPREKNENLNSSGEDLNKNQKRPQLSKVLSNPKEIVLASYQNAANNLLSNLTTQKPIQNIIPLISNGFNNQGKISWKQFIEIVQKYSDTQESTLNQIKFILTNKNMVLKETWEKVAEWYQPLYPCHTSRSLVSEQGYTFMDIANITSNSWFFGFLSTQSSVEVLWEKPNGSFLFRFSSQPVHYALSVSNGTQVGHWRIKSIPTLNGLQFLVDDKSYSSLQEIISSHLNDPLHLLNSPDPSKTVTLSNPISRPEND